MTTKTLARTNHSLSLWLAAVVLAAGSIPASGQGAFGTVIPLNGHISEMVLDEPRGLLYAANFTGGTVDVISLTTNRLTSSMNVGGQPAGLAMSPDGRWLVIPNYANFGVNSLNSITVVDLADLTRRNFATSSPPLAVAFGSDGVALVVTTVDLQRFRPSGGTFERVATIASMATALPVPDPTFPREITKASMTASGDGNYIFGATDTFVFVYQAPSPAAVLQVRLLTTFIHKLSPPLVTASFDGSYVLAGQYLMDRRLRVMAEHPGSDISNLNLGGHVVDFGLRTVYSSFPDVVPAPPPTTGTGTSTVTAAQTAPSLLPAQLLVQDADNLSIRDRLRLPERVTGRMLLAGGGRSLYAVSDSGVTWVQLSELARQPQVRPSVEQLFFQFDFCQRTPLRAQFQIRNTGGPADFEISTLLRGVTVSPSRGTAPATVEVTVDFSQYSTVQGTTFGQFLITSQNAVNAVLPIQLSINVKDQDQRGRVVPVPGKLVDVLADNRREQFYVLEQTKNELHAFANADLRLLGTFRTGNRPTWLSLSADRRHLMVANSSGENLTVINLDTMQNEGYLFMPPGHNPISVAADNGTVLAAVRTPTATQIDWVNLSGRTAFPLGRLGVYENKIDDNTVMVPLADMSGIFIAEADGRVMLWDTAKQEVVIARKDFTALGGAVAAGPSSVVAANNIMNLSLVPQSAFTDPPNVPAGFVFIGEGSVKTTAPTGAFVDTGAVQRFDVRTPGVRQSPVRMVEQPATPGLGSAFLRSLAALRNGTIVSTTSSGLVELPGNFDAGIQIPRITAITSASDFSDRLAAGSLVSIFGQNLAPTTASSGSLPLPTQVANICVTISGVRMPLLYASPGQINGQLPFELVGRLQTVIHAPGGKSDTYFAQVRSEAPSVFQINISGQSGTFPAVIRTRNSLLTTLSNPLRPNEPFLIFASGLGPVGPPVVDGTAAPSDPLATTRSTPRVVIGDREAGVLFAGLAPGFVGLYQLNVLVPGDAPLGMQIPVTITSGSLSTTINVRIVE